MYDYGARFYDPSISLWTSVDPLASKYPDYSAYNYVMGNPIKYVDPDGRKVINADRIRLNKYKSYLASAQKSLSKYSGLTNKQIKAQFGKTGLNKSRSLRKHEKSFKRNIQIYTKRSKQTDVIISNWKKEAPKVFEKVDALHVDLHLGVDGKYINEGVFGVTTSPKEVNGNIVFEQKTGKNALSIFINSDVNISSPDPETSEYSLNHEAGHFIFAVENPQQYLNERQAIKKSGDDYDGGHHKNATTGKEAAKYGAKKDL